VGLVPAAGRGSRLGLPGSKEVVDVGAAGTGADARPRPVAAHLLAAMATAGVARAWIVLRRDKGDVPRALGAGGGPLPPLRYLEIAPTASVAETVDRALPAVGAAEVAFGFPDILFAPADALARLVAHRRASGADLALALFPTDRPDKADLVDLDAAGRIRRLLVKPGAAAAGDLRLTWILAVWTAPFSRFLHRFLAAGRGGRGREGAGEGELQLSEVVQAAIEDGMEVAPLTVAGGSYLDVGTPDDLARARERFGGAARQLR
jgi:glucose-1-phosphate thymidylyltransferase